MGDVSCADVSSSGESGVPSATRVGQALSTGSFGVNAIGDRSFADGDPFDMGVAGATRTRSCSMTPRRALAPRHTRSR